jgi:hypothetical protein
MVVVAALMFVPPLSADDRTEKEIAGAKAFNIEGVKLGMPKGEFLRLFPEAFENPDRSRPDIGVVALQINKTAKTNGINVSLLDGKVIDVYAFYSSSQVASMGGLKALLDRLVAKLGKADAKSPVKTEKGTVELFWRIYEASFYCKIVENAKVTAINYTDMAAWGVMRDRQKEVADPGF